MSDILLRGAALSDSAQGQDERGFAVTTPEVLQRGCELQRVFYDLFGFFRHPATTILLDPHPALLRCCSHCYLHGYLLISVVAGPLTRLAAVRCCPLLGAVSLPTKAGFGDSMERIARCYTLSNSNMLNILRDKKNVERGWFVLRARRSARRLALAPMIFISLA
ncbi:MAG: hypothetical protein KDI55_02345 [Anaerolineae bacterium]|nr:hypothetical protein [Anaerolineae bacterium]